MGLENGNENEKRSDILKAALVVAALATPFYGHKNVEAAEIPQSASWEVGVEKYKELALHEKVEYGGNLVLYRGSSLHWVQPWTSGSWRTVDSKAREKSAAIRELGDFKKIEAVCKFHTHPDASSRRAFRIPETTEVPPFAPPSRGDLSIQNMAGTSDLAHGIGISMEKVYKAVFDARGVWYYRQATDADLREDTEYWQRRERLKEMQSGVRIFKIQAQDWLGSLSDETVFKLGQGLPTEVKEKTNTRDKDAVIYALSRVLYSNKSALAEEILAKLPSDTERDRYRDAIGRMQEAEKLDDVDADEETKFKEVFKIFVTGSISKDFDFEKSYAELQKAYLRGIDAVVRFVPYNKLGVEPPCAGVDYKPQ